MRSIESAVASWQKLKQYKTLPALRAAVRLDEQRSIATSGLRSACWKAFLLFDSADTSTWQKTLASSRSAYNSLRLHFLRHLENPDELTAGLDPLSEESESSPWTSLRRDEELRAEILQDVERCMPENLYFRQPEAQRMLLDILFVFCKLNPDVSYRQGMHEVLAPILWVIERDAVKLGETSKAMGEDAIVNAIFDADHVEHDTFALFSQIMQSAKNFYEQTTHSGKVNPMIARSQRIFDDLLPRVDVELLSHLKKIDIVPQVFLMRWIRLLFGREFTFDSMLGMWDIIFAEDPSLEIVDHISVVMLLRMRWELLEADYNAALTLLLRHSMLDKDVHAQTFVLDALYLRDHMNIEGGKHLILQHSGRAPRNIDGALTPPASQRNITAFSGAYIRNAASPNASQSLPRTPWQPLKIEELVQATAKTVYAHGEKLGIGRAVRNAVDEVHKRAQEVRTSQIQSPAIWQSRSARTSPGASFQRIKALEDRNKELAKQLEGAVAELWDYQKVVAESDNSEKVEAGSLEKLSLAIAKAQFVQVYLADINLPLPLEEPENMDRNAFETSADSHTSIQTKEEDRTPAFAANADNYEPSPTRQTTQSAESDGNVFPVIAPAIPNIVEGDPRHLSPNADQHASEMTPQPQLESDSGSGNVNKMQPANSAEKSGESQGSRPPLSQSAFSWMLGQEDSVMQAPARASPTTSNRARARGFLFGDEDQRDASRSQEQKGSKRESNSESGPSTSHGANDEVFDLSTLRRGRGMQK